MSKLKFIKIVDRFDVFNHKKEYLGEIGYWNKWKCWVWEQKPDVIMSIDCLEEVRNKMKELEADKK